MSYKIEKFNDRAGEARFRLVAPNGEIMMSSEGYDSPSNRDRGLDSLLMVFGCRVEETLAGERITEAKGGPREVQITES